ncbi:retrovirus-related pol polyprotein from transposon TNT 1-94 [Tanacetum coccineum]
MILESVEHGPLIWPTVEENGVIRTKKYVELSAAEKIQADCDMKATNIILQGLPADIYSLMNHHRVAKDLWERVQLLMQGTSLTKQERECKLYDAFDKFTHIKGESLHTYYLRFTQLINDMNIYKMKMEQFQVNTKFLNSLPPEWSKFVTDVKLVKDLHTSNFDQLHAYLEQHELHANKVRIMRERNQDPLAFVARSTCIRCKSADDTTSLQHLSVLSVFLQQSSTSTTVFTITTWIISTQSTLLISLSITNSIQSFIHSTITYISVSNESSNLNCFVVPVFSPGDDPIACLNKAMAFLTVVASSSNATSSRGNTTSGHARVVKCYNCQGEGYMARQCTQPKRPRNAAWYKEKAMLVEAQEAGQILDEEQLVFLADLRIPAGQAQTIIPHNADIISEVPNSETYLNDMDNQSVHALQDFEQSPVMDFTDNEISSDSNIIPYSQYLQETQQATVQDTNLQAQQDSMILSVIEQMSEQMINHVNNWEKANKEQNNESITAELERYKERVKTFEQRLNIDLSSREKMIDSQMDDMIREKLALKEQIDSLEQNLSKQIKEKESLFKTFTVFKNESKEKENKYMENEIDLEKKIKELDNIICKVGQSAQTVHMLTKPQAFYDNTHKQALGYQNPFYLKKAQRIKPTLYDGVVMSKTHVAMPVIDVRTLILEEGEVDQHVSLVNASLKKLKFHLAQFDSMGKKRTTPNTLKEERANTLRELVEQAKVKQPLDSELDFAYQSLQAIKIDRISQTPSETRRISRRQLRKVIKRIVLLNTYFDVDVKTFTVNMRILKFSVLLVIIYVDGGHVFAEVRFKWKPTGRTFTIVGNSCPFNLGCPDCTLVSGPRCSKHMTGNRSQLMNFVSKFMGTIRFGNDQITRVMGCGDYQMGNVVISKVYYVEGLGYNLFSVGQFCDTDLGVAFRKNICFIRNLEGVDLLSGSRDTNLYKISLDDMLKSYPICLLSKASKTKSWLWHRRLSHLNFGTLNKLAKDGLARGLPRLKFQKDHLCSACALGKSKKSSHQPKAEIHFMNFMKMLASRIKTSVSPALSSGSVLSERRNKTIVEATRTMLIFSKAPLFIWAEAINTTRYTQNRSLIRHRYNKTPYELMQDKKPDLSFLHVFGSLCYPTNDHED